MEEQFEGNFTYVPVEIDNEVRGYYLIGYGNKRLRNIDVDGDGRKDPVVVILRGPSKKVIRYEGIRERGEWMHQADEIFHNLPPLKDLLD